MTDWKLVPVEPTEEMIAEAERYEYTVNKLRAAIAAAPIPPSTPDDDALVGIGWQAARNAWIATHNMMEAVKAAVRAILPHLRAPARGYTVRWEGAHAYVGKNSIARVYNHNFGVWRWVAPVSVDQTIVGNQPTEAAAKHACEAAIHEYMAGFGLVPVPTEGTFREGLEAAARRHEKMAESLRHQAEQTREKCWSHSPANDRRAHFQNAQKLEAKAAWHEQQVGPIRALATKREG